MMQELDKHLRYMEKSIKQLKQSSKRNKAKAQKMIQARTEENRNLLKTIEELRQIDQGRQKKQEEIDKKINQIKQQYRIYENEKDRYKEEIRKLQISGGIPSLNKHKAQDFYNEKKNDDQKDVETYKRSQSRGKIIKGSVFTQKATNINQTKIELMVEQLTESSKTILLQNLQKKTLQEKLEAIQLETL